MPSHSDERDNTSPRQADDEGSAALPMPSPELAARFARVDDLFAGLTRAEALQAARTLYHDADGNLQARSQRIQFAAD